MSKWLVVAAFVVEAVGCGYGSEPFTCANDTQCGPNGLCDQTLKLCSVPVPTSTCSSGYSFGGLAGDQAGKCASGIGSGPGAGSGPGHIADAMIDTPPDAQTCFGTGIVKVCLQSAPTMPYMTDGATTIPTDNSPLCAKLAPNQPDYCVVAATTISIQSKLQASGGKPLVLLASDSITTSGLIDVGSHRTNPEVIGAGADDSTCDPGGKPANGGGGAGGSFTGNGGAGGSTQVIQAKGGLPGKALDQVTTLRGGCPGQDGDGGKKGSAGHGGGAVFLIAVNTISIGGDINAAGEGATAGGGNTSGAGGGGSGGMIGFDAPIVTGANLLLANGGSGGEGSGNNNTDPGSDGADPSSIVAAKGGSGTTALGGDGGDGSAGVAGGIGGNGAAGAFMTTARFGGGGGGGGGAGVIIAPANANLGTNISPAITNAKQ